MSPGTYFKMIIIWNHKHIHISYIWTMFIEHRKHQSFLPAPVTSVEQDWVADEWPRGQRGRIWGWRGRGGGDRRRGNGSCPSSWLSALTTTVGWGVADPAALTFNPRSAFLSWERASVVPPSRAADTVRSYEKEVVAMMERGFACHFFHLSLTLVFKSGLVANLATRWPHWHCHNALDCLIGIISLVLTWYLHSSSARATSVKSLTDRHPHGSDLGKKWQKMNKMDKMLQHFLSTLLSIKEPGWLTGSFPLAMFILKETSCSIWIEGDTFRNQVTKKCGTGVFFEKYWHVNRQWYIFLPSLPSPPLCKLHLHKMH